MLRDILSSVIPDYHINKRLWNTVTFDDSIAKGEIKRMIVNSFTLVVNKVTKQEQRSMLLSE